MNQNTASLSSRSKEEPQKLVERLKLATHAAQMGIWDWDIQKNELIWDDQMYRLYGLKPDEFGGAYEAWLNGVHPDDRAPSNAASQQAVRGEKEYDTEFRVLWPDGSIHWLKANGQVFRDEKGNPLRMVGVNYDITERKQTEGYLFASQKLLQEVSDNSNSLIYAVDSVGRFLLINRSLESMFGVPRTSIIGKMRADFMPSEIATEHHNNDLHIIAEQRPITYEEENIEPDGKHTYISVKFPLFDMYNKIYGIGGISTDITERKQAEKQIVQMKRLYATLSQVNQTIVRVKDHADLYQSICDVSTKFGEFALAWIGILDAETGDVKPVAASGLNLTQWPFPQVNIHEGDFKNGLAATAMRTSRVITSDDIEVDERTRQSQASIINYDYHSTAIVPFQLRGTTIGILSLVSSEAELFKSQDEILLLKEMGGDISFALDTMETEAERKRAEQTLRESAENYKTLFESNPHPMWVYDLESLKFLTVNEAAIRHYGYSYEEFLGMSLLDIRPAGDFQRLVENITAVDQGLDKAGNWQHVRKDGSIIDVEITSHTLNYYGHMAELVLANDITAQKQAEKKIQRQLELINGLHAVDQAISSNLEMEAILHIVLQQVHDLLKADAVSILLFNDPLQKLMYAASRGFRSATVSQSQTRLGEGLAGQVGQSQNLLHIPNLAQIGDKFLRAEMLKEDQFVEYLGIPLIAKDTLKGVLEIFNRTPLNPDAEWLNFLEVLGGQTAIAIDNAQLFEELQRSNAELEQRVKMRTTELLLVNAELEHANRTKDEFLANMSHELRTPLTGIIGLTESLLLSTYGQPNEKQSNALKNIEASGRHLLELINDILDLSKIESGKFDIYPEMLDIEETCRASLIFVREQATKKSISLEYQEVKDVKSAFADSRRLKQILVNLLSNAVKFTPEKGKVTLAVSTDPEKKQIHFSVADTGIGIAKENLDRLFSPFTQVDSRLNRQYEGTGLGLVLVLRLAEMHGGNVQVETEPGKGSRFTVSLPWQAQVSTPIETTQAYIEAPAETVPNLNGVVLLVEDNDSNVETIGDYLQFKGYTLVLASNGIEALIKAEESNPDLILMDIQMPVMDGLEATRRLRADRRFKSTPIIALTALAMTGDRERCIEAGATDYLSKPVSLKELAQKIEKLLHP